MRSSKISVVRCLFVLILVPATIASCTRLWPGPRTAAEYYNRGNVRGKQGDFSGAIADFTKAIELNPTFALAYTYRGNARSHSGDPDGAIADSTKAIELDPKLALAYSNRGNARYRKGD